MTGAKPEPFIATHEHHVEFVYDKDEHIVINRKVYKRSDFKEEQVQATSVVNFADQQLASKAQELQICNWVATSWLLS